MRLASFMLGLATGFMVTACLSFAFNGLFGFYYLIAGGLFAAISVIISLMESVPKNTHAPTSDWNSPKP